MVTATQAYLAFLGLLGAERLVELAISRRNARVAFAKGAIEVGQTHFRWMAIFHAAFLVACAAEVLIFDRPAPPRLTAFFLAGAVLAQGLRYWAIATLGERWNVRVIVLPTAPPVTHGPYRFVRHPNYLAVVIEMAFVPLIHGAWMTALFFSACNALLLSVRIRTEERAMGESYAYAFAGTARLVPGVRRR
jgi:methyltransferase